MSYDCVSIIHGKFIHIDKIREWLDGDITEKELFWIDPRYVIGYDKEKIRKNRQSCSLDIDFANDPSDSVIVDYLGEVLARDRFFNKEKYKISDVDLINAVIYLICDLHSTNTAYTLAWAGSYLLKEEKTNINFERIYMVFKYEKNEHILNLLRIFMLETFELNETYPYLSQENKNLFEQVKQFSTVETSSY